MNGFLKLTSLSVALLAVACSSPEVMSDKKKMADGGAAAVMVPTVKPGMRDSDLTIPAGYRSWPVFLGDIDKPDAKQIRDIYVSPNGHKTARGDAFPVGTIFVMETWKPKMASDGTLARSASGKLVKDELQTVFAMAKSAGAGALVEPAQANGDWVYAGYKADGVTPGGPPASACRSCHLPEAAKDWVFRYDEYFAKRGG